jgi:hypothetical protein
MVSQHKQSPGATAVPDTVENYIDGVWTPSTNDDGQPLTRRQARNSHRSRFRANRISTRWSELLTTRSRSDARHRRLSAASISSRSRPNSTSVSTTSRRRSRASTAKRLGRRKARFAAGVPNMLREGSGNVEDVARGLDEFAIRQLLACSRRLRNASSLYTERDGEARKYCYEGDAGTIGVSVSVCAPMGFFIPAAERVPSSAPRTPRGEDPINFYADKTIEIEHWYGE